MKRILTFLSILFILLSGCGTASSFKKELEVINGFFNAKNMNLSIRLKMDKETSSSIKVYYDDEYYEIKSPDALEVMSMDATYISASGFKGYAKGSNLLFFSSIQSEDDITNYITQYKSKSGDNCHFKMNLAKLMESSPLFPNIGLEQIADEYGINLKSVNTVVTIYDKREVTKIDFDLSFKYEGSKIDFHLNYDIKGYGDSFYKERDFYLDDFTEVNARQLLFIGSSASMSVKAVANDKAITFGEVSPSLVVGQLETIEAKTDPLPIYYEEIYKDNDKFYYTLAGRTFELEIYADEDATVLYPSSHIPFNDSIKDPIQYCFKKDSLIGYCSNGKLNIYDLNESKVTSTIFIGGQVIKTEEYEDRYHIISSYKDSYGFFISTTVSVIDKKTLTLSYAFELNSIVIDQTTIDKRGDIILSTYSIDGGLNSLYVYHPETDQIENIPCTQYNNFSTIYYDESEDMVICFALSNFSNSKSLFFKYENGHYVEKKDQSQMRIDISSVWATFGQYALGGETITDLSSWKQLKQSRFDFGTDLYNGIPNALKMVDGNSFYAMTQFLKSKQEISIFIAIHVSGMTVSTECYVLPIYIFYYHMMFVHEGKIYVLSKDEQYFVIFDLPLSH